MLTNKENIYEDKNSPLTIIILVILLMLKIEKLREFAREGLLEALLLFGERASHQ